MSACEKDYVDTPTFQQRLWTALGLLLALAVILFVLLNWDEASRQVGFAGGYGYPEGTDVSHRFVNPDVERGPRPAGAGAEEIVEGEYVLRLRSDAAAGAAVAAGKLTGVAPDLLAAVERAGATGLKPALALRPGRAGAAADRLRGAVRFRSALSLDGVREALEADPDVESVEPLVRARATSAEPDDEWYHFQWGMAQLGVAELHERYDGTGIVVAVIDSGVAPSGPDGVPNLATGWDFVDDDGNATDDDAAAAGESHGTHVAGTIAQRTRNGEGTVGVAPGALVLPVRVLGYDPALDAVVGDTDDIAAGIVWAVDHGAQIINLSLGSITRTDLVADACAYAVEEGVLVVAASGNDGYDDAVLYPARLPGVLAVGAVGRQSVVTAYSNGGAELDIVAPGGESGEDRDGDNHGDGIVQETFGEDGWRYRFMDGTSMASPHVAGAAALLMQRGWTSPTAVAEVLTRTAKDLGDPGHDPLSGYGEIDLLAAMALPVDPAALAESGSVEIRELAVDYSPDGRAWIGWRTDVAATSEADGEVDEVPSRMHSVQVRGTPGESRDVTVRSRSGSGDEATAALTLDFPLPAADGCSSAGRGAALGPAAAALLLALRRRVSSRA